MGAPRRTNEIGVSVKDGVVTLTGWVDSYTKRWAAEDAAHRVRGVKAVAGSFGIVVLIWPGLTPWQLAMLFGAYVSVDGVLALIVGFNVKGPPGCGALLFEGSSASASRCVPLRREGERRSL